MYAHDLIDQIKNETRPEFQKIIRTTIPAIKDSIHIHMGEYFKLLRFVDKKEYRGVVYFNDVLGIDIQPPFKNTCISYSVDNRDKNTCLSEEQKKKGAKQISKAILLVHVENDFSRMTVITWCFFPDKAKWNCLPFKWNVENLKSNDISGVTVSTMFDEVSAEECHSMLDLMKGSECRLLNFALMLLNTKNITTIDNPPPARLNKKRVKNGKQPLFTYKTLRLQLPAKKRRKGSGPAMATNNTTRLHLCRGHFKTYTEDKPLLGKFTGRYWWQPHARGDKSQGVVMKDYEVKI